MNDFHVVEGQYYRDLDRRRANRIFRVKLTTTEYAIVKHRYSGRTAAILQARLEPHRKKYRLLTDGELAEEIRREQDANAADEVKSQQAATNGNQVC